MHALTLLNNFPYVPSTFTVLRRASSVADEVRWCGVLSFFLPTRSPDACLHACAWSAERAACAGLERSQVGETLSPSHPSAYLAAWLPYAYTRADCQYVHSIIVPHAAPASAPPIPTTLFLGTLHPTVPILSPINDYIQGNKKQSSEIFPLYPSQKGTGPIALILN